MKHYFTRFEEAVKNNWERPALANFRGESFTFGEFATQIARFHVFFEAIGLKKGDKVALCAKNSARWGVTFFAANTYEAVLVPILADFHPDSVNSLVDHSESKILLTDSDIWTKLDITKMPSVQAVISSSDFSLLYAADEAISQANEKLQEIMPEIDDLLKRHFRPEFLNRIDEIVTFGRLEKDAIYGIVKNQLYFLKLVFRCQK